MSRLASNSLPNRVFRSARRVVVCGLVLWGAAQAFQQVEVARATESDGAPVVTFTGLRVSKDGSATLFVELTRTTDVQVSRDGKDVSFLLAGAKVRWRNNKNPLLADHFGTNVVRAALRDGKDGVRLVVRLREDVRLDHEMTDSASGARLRVNVPPPSTP